MLKPRVDMLEYIYDTYNEILFNNELPVIAITIQNNGKSNFVMGWCSARPCWINVEGLADPNDENAIGERILDEYSEKWYEINISAEYLGMGTIETVGTLLHEMVHLYHCMKGIKDCSGKGYHNKTFKEKCEEIGLKCELIKGKGYCKTSVSEELINSIEKLNIPDIFNVMRIKEVKTKQAAKKRYKYECKKCGLKMTSSEDGVVVECVKCKSNLDCINTDIGKKEDNE